MRRKRKRKLRRIRKVFRGWRGGFGTLGRNVFNRWIFGAMVQLLPAKGFAG